MFRQMSKEIKLIPELRFLSLKGMENLKKNPWGISVIIGMVVEKNLVLLKTGNIF